MKGAALLRQTQKRKQIGRHCQYGAQSPNMIPCRPAGKKMRPEYGPVHTGCVHPRQRAIQRNIENRCSPESTSKIEQASEKKKSAAPLRPRCQRVDRQCSAQNRAAKQNRHKKWRHRFYVDGLHGGNPLWRRKTRKRRHHKARKSEKHASHETGANQGCDRRTPHQLFE